MKRKIKVTIEDRADGGINVSSDDVPGLILSGRNRTLVIADIGPAIRAILEHKGEDANDLQIDAVFVSG